MIRARIPCQVIGTLKLVQVIPVVEILVSVASLRSIPNFKYSCFLMLCYWYRIFKPHAWHLILVLVGDWWSNTDVEICWAMIWKIVLLSILAKIKPTYNNQGKAEHQMVRIDGNCAAYWPIILLYIFWEKV